MIYRIKGVRGSEFVYSKIIESVKLGEYVVHHFRIEVGDMNDRFDLDSIIRLDLLQHMKAIINLDLLTLEYSQN